MPKQFKKEKKVLNFAKKNKKSNNMSRAIGQQNFYKNKQELLNILFNSTIG